MDHPDRARVLDRLSDETLRGIMRFHGDHLGCLGKCASRDQYLMARELLESRRAYVGPEPVPTPGDPASPAMASPIDNIPLNEPPDSDYVFGLNQLASRIAFTNRDKGFGDPSLENIHTKLLLAVSELCEAQEHLRDGHRPDEVFWRKGTGATVHGDPNAWGVLPGDKPDGFPIELADAVIRILHICNALDIDIAAAIALKVKYNRTRPVKHGRQF